MDLAIGDYTKFPDYFTPNNLNNLLQNESNDKPYYNMFIERQDTIPKLLEKNKESNIENIERVIIKASLSIAPIEKKDSETQKELEDRLKSEEKFSNFVTSYKNILTENAIKKYYTTLDDKSKKIEEIKPQIFDKEISQNISLTKEKLAPIKPTKEELQIKQSEIDKHPGAANLTERTKKSQAIETVDKEFNDCREQLQETKEELDREIKKYSRKAENMSFGEKQVYQVKLKEIRNAVKTLDSKFVYLSSSPEIEKRAKLRAQLESERATIIERGKNDVGQYNTLIIEKNKYVQAIKAFESKYPSEMALVRRAQTIIDGSISSLHEPINNEKKSLDKLN